MRALQNGLASLAVALLLANTAAGATYPTTTAASNNNADNNSDNAADAPRRYIVELKTLGCGERVRARIAAAGGGLRVARSFDHELFPALSIECDSGRCDADSLARVLGGDGAGSDVAAVYTPSVMTLRLPEAGPSYADDAAAANYTFHGVTGVEELHAQGIMGEGATVAIVDSGVEWTHEALGGGFGRPSDKIIGGYDLVGDGNWPSSPATPDSEPNDQFGHGTHVAGIVAGKSGQFVGVAPAAKILAYKVIGASGQSNEEMVIEGFLRAFDSGADIITASVGEKGGFTDSAWATVASRMVDRGVLVTVAGGNDGEDGAFLMSNGAAGKNVLTVAATAPDMVPAYPFTVSFSSGLNTTAERQEVGYSPANAAQGPDFFPGTIANWPIIPLTLDPAVPADACQPVTTPPAALTSQSILLARTGGCPLYTKQTNLAALNASYILFYQDNATPYVAPTNRRGQAKIAIIDAPAGEAIVKALRASQNSSVTASFDKETTRFVGLRDANGAGRPAVFTQWGPNYDMELKPDVAAPGVRVLSSYIGGGYKVLSGTSMATPYVAGVAALWVGKHGGRKGGDPDWAKKLAVRIMSTARSAPWVDDLSGDVVEDFLAPPVQVGAGSLHAGRIFAATTTLDFEGRKFALNDTAHFEVEHAVQITNTAAAAGESVTYTFSVEPAAGFNSWTPRGPGEPSFGQEAFKGYFDFKPQRIAPDVTLPLPLTLAPGESGTAKFTFSPPTGVDQTQIPLYGGRVIITASNGQTLAIPYAGAAADIKTVVPGSFARVAGMPNMVTKGDIPIATKSNVTFDLSRDVQDFPLLVVAVTYGTRELRWDIYEAPTAHNSTDGAGPDVEGEEKDLDAQQWEYPPIAGRKGYVGSATAWSGSGTTSYFDPARDDDKDVYAFPRYNLPRDVYKQYINGSDDGLAGGNENGTGTISKIQPGRYRMRVAALRPFGDPTVAGDWDVWKTPVLTVLPLESPATNGTGVISAAKRAFRPRL
ncbi:peptidase S8/S53 domain-containing protein [Microdochium bolleyi]|uniref:Peptidase S8/S53 domain-containing protein n=1 Tax=Microdochium bolleyi TaxID=196109 RepID=A0A136IR77_9PEZI|nr:peptidase S8/S53 domain-containing protein [Microdochium bolleyi]